MSVRALAWVAVVACAAACGKSSPKGSVLLFIGTDTDGAHRIFEQPPGFAAASVAPLDDLEVRTAVVSPGGRAIAVHSPDDTLHVLRPDGKLDVVRHEKSLARVAAVDDAGRIVVGVTANDDLVIAGERSEVIHPAGKLVYGIALSGNGQHLAYSTMDASCAATPAGMQTCTVTLWGVNLVAAGYEPRKLVDEGAVVAYDPAFFDADGALVLYMTNLGDTSPGCTASVRNCIYQLRRVPFDGGASQKLVDDAIVGRAFPDGAIVYRRLAGERGGDRQWTSPAVMLAEPGKPPVELVAQAPLQVPRPSLDGKWLAVVRDDQATPIRVVDRTGAEKATVGGEVELLGWAAKELPRGKQMLAKPRATRMQEAAEAEVRRNGGKVIAADELCRDIRQVRGKAVISFGDIVVVRDSPRASQGMPVTPWRITMSPRGAMHLVDVDLPVYVRAGQIFLVTLHWHVDEPVGYGWKVFVHFDVRHGIDRFNGDHLVGGCAELPPDDDLYDTFAVEAGAMPGQRDVYAGWFRADGTRAHIEGMHDDRLSIGTVYVR